MHLLTGAARARLLAFQDLVFNYAFWPFFCPSPKVENEPFWLMLDIDWFYQLKNCPIYTGWSP